MPSQKISVIATVPSNIALVKYWGKRDPETQWPANDSLSMTLSVAKSITEASVIDGQEDRFFLNDKGFAATCAAKPLNHLRRLRRELGFSSALLIHSSNTFPTSCGIASSASGLGALTLAAIGAWTGAQSWEDLAACGYSMKRLQALARLGSGSACRSFLGGFVEWEAGPSSEAQQINLVANSEHWPLADIIVVVSAAAKPTLSSEGHLAAWTSPLFQPRLALLPERLDRVKAAIKRRDLEDLGREIEAEALDMHAVMLSSKPAANYLLPATSHFLAWLRAERLKSGLSAYFTLDAGPNPHVICERDDAAWVANRIQAEFPQFDLLVDAIGDGPTFGSVPKAENSEWKKSMLTRRQEQ